MKTTTLEFAPRFEFAPGTDERQLVCLSRDGDQEAFACLYDAYIERIYRYIYYRVADVEIAEDIASQVFLKAWEKLGTFQVGSTPFIAWLYRIAHNAVIDYYRTRKVSLRLDDVSRAEVSHEESIDERLDRQVEAQQLRDALKELTSEQQEVLMLKFIGGLSTLEIAHQLGKQQGAVRALQMRALQGMAKSLQLREDEMAERLLA
jgi:RNA polymerase sigma-70 factor (ECF subfamily)